MEKLLVGYGKTDITPVESVPLRGYGATEKRMSTANRSALYQIALAITDPQGNTCILIASDTCGIDRDTAVAVCSRVSREWGIPADHVMISALHQHSAPDLRNERVPSSGRYREEIYIPGAVAAARAAMENRTPATVQVTRCKTEGMNFVRHYIMEDGSYAGPNFGRLKTLTPVSHATRGDSEMQLIKFLRSTGGADNPDIVLVNYQGHLLMGTSAKNTEVHSDLIGVFREVLEQELGCNVIYFSGAGGNMMFKSAIEEENRSTDYIDHGKLLARYVLKAEAGYRPLSGTAIRVSKITYQGEFNHSEDHLLEKATEVWEAFRQTGNLDIFRENGFESQYHCALLIKHANLPETGSFDLVAMAVGDIVFAGYPCEMFCDTGMAIKSASPFPVTVICTIANGYNGYLPANMAWDYGCYERHNSDFRRGTAEEVAAVSLEMMHRLRDRY